MQGNTTTLIASKRLFLMLCLFVGLVALMCPPAQAQIPILSQTYASDGLSGDQFGTSVAVSGKTMVVGAPLANNECGAAYVFALVGSAWSQVAKLSASDAQQGDKFGFSVGISGSVIVVGAYSKNSFAGAAYVFTLSNGAWNQTTKLTPSDSLPKDYFGNCVTISGSTIVVGTSNKNSGVGAIYVFTLSNGVWMQTYKLTPNDSGQGDLFGNCIAIYKSTIVAGAVDKNGGTGAAYVFTRSGAIWVQRAKLSASDAQYGDQFGWSVAIYGNTIVVGSPYAGATGVAYVFKQFGTAWTQQAKLTARDAQQGDAFGISVAISSTQLAVSAPGKDSNDGAVYIFNINGYGTLKLTLSEESQGSGLGVWVGLSGNSFVAGAPLGGGPGSVYTTP